MANALEISKEDLYLFGQGTHYEIYKKMGAHLTEVDGKKGAYFAVWAPNAKEVHVIGEFNDWNEETHPLNRLGEIGIYAGFISDVKENQNYKFLITTMEKEKRYKADPFGNYAEYRPGTASKITNISNFYWKDDDWMLQRQEKNMFTEPMSIYECHIGSFMRHPNGEKEGYYTYREFADKIVSYFKEMPYTHVELMGIAEHPYDGSWGYQVTGYYAPTSRYGTPQDFKYLVETLHKNGIGVILDWVPAHFPKDAHGLAEFDGQALFEHPDPRRGEQPDWGTKIFNYERSEVSNFLLANALFWVEQFHIDGLRVDAVASMLYLDYAKQEGEWLPNKYGGNENLAAIEFFKHLNSVMKARNPGVLTIAEESTAWPKVTGSPENGGLGFTYKWNMGWMHDFCEYMKLDPIFRKDEHYKMTFAMSYNESERYILPLSHDEVVHLKCSLVNKMPGYMVDKFANLRLGYTYMFGHEGKKLLFMGQDFAQLREWSEERELDWYLLEDEKHKGIQQYVKKLLLLYRNYACLHEIDSSWDGFQWMNADDAERSIYSFVRRAKTETRELLFIINMTPITRENYQVGVPKKGEYKLLLNSEEICYGGTGKKIPAQLRAKYGPCNNQQQSIQFDLPAYGAAIFEY
jgi:1,4-alpha-glucan branching enzyme